MGICPSKDDSATHPCDEQGPEILELRKKLRVLGEEIELVLQQRDEEKKGYEREVMGFERKEAKWKKERKRLKEEAKRLRRRCLLKEIREEGVLVVGNELGGASDKEGRAALLEGMVVSSSLLMEQMKEERARRDEAVEKWKMLYLDIKNELDDLIERTHQGCPMCWRGGGGGGGRRRDEEEKEELIREMKRELKSKDELIQDLKAQIAAMEQEEYKRKREFDILRQSLRIITSKKKASAS